MILIFVPNANKISILSKQLQPICFIKYLSIKIIRLAKKWQNLSKIGKTHSVSLLKKMHYLLLGDFNKLLKTC
jgi:uncharacterized protein involved in propanediol utilization